MNERNKNIILRKRKSPFVRLFDKTPPSVVCPHFYELILSNGCPYNCEYCYLKLTFRGKIKPTLFTNNWAEVQKELDLIPKGVFSTGELADSLALIPPLLIPAINYFTKVKNKYLLLLTKSTNIKIFEKLNPHNNIIISFSVNAVEIARKWEKGAPPPIKRLEAALKLKERGWRIRIRIDPIILEGNLLWYRNICKIVAELKPERVTIGTLRSYPGLFRFSPKAPRKGLKKCEDGRMRYPIEQRITVYKKIAEWLGFEPALCKETRDVWKKLKWHFYGCNCTE